MKRYIFLLVFSILTVLTSVSWYAYNQITKSNSQDNKVKDVLSETIQVDTPKIIQITNELVGKSYVWQNTLKNEKIVSRPVLKNKDKFVLSFDSLTNLKSSTDCNSVSGEYLLNKKELKVKNLVSTEMFCVDSQEEEYIKDLSSAYSFEIEGNQLIITLLDNKKMLFILKDL